MEKSIWGLKGMVLKGTKNGKFWKLLYEKEALILNSIVLYQGQVLIGGGVGHYEDHIGILRVDRQNETIVPYLEEAIDTTFMQVIEDTLYAGGGSNIQLYKIQEKQIIDRIVFEFLHIQEAE